MKLITTFPLERYDDLAFVVRKHSGTAVTSRGHYTGSTNADTALARQTHQAKSGNRAALNYSFGG